MGEAPDWMVVSWYDAWDFSRRVIESGKVAYGGGVYGGGLVETPT
jgi:hypothetical protein